MAFDFVSSAPPSENGACIALDTGRIHWTSDRDNLDEQADEIFRRRGAYARFKQLLDFHGALEKWYEFEQESTEAALRNWCSENGVQLRERGDGSST